MAVVLLDRGSGFVASAAEEARHAEHLERLVRVVGDRVRPLGVEELPDPLAAAERRAEADHVEDAPLLVPVVAAEEALLSEPELLPPEARELLSVAEVQPSLVEVDALDAPERAAFLAPVARVLDLRERLEARQRTRCRASRRSR